MARTPSNMLPLSTQIEDFELFDTVTQKMLSLSDITSEKPFVIMFICNHCPFVVHLHKGLQMMVNRYKEKVDFIAISSNDIEKYPEDRPELMTKLFLDLNFDFPYLFDENQLVAKKLDAACTPDFYLFNAKKQLIYRGQFDHARPGNEVEVSGKDLMFAIDQALERKVIREDLQKPSLGCNIKWK